MADLPMLSVKELNEILQNFQKNELPLFGTSEADIMFVAGLLLLYKQYEKDEMNRLKALEILELIKRYDYFKQIEKLYLPTDSLFKDFSSAELIEGQSETKIYFQDYIPPIYITEKTLNCFFKNENDNNIKDVKNEYRDKFDILVFINKKFSNYQDFQEKFSEYEAEIKQRLEASSPIFTFIFIIASKKLAEKKGETFESLKNYVEKLWLFTQDYVQGLYELAKNIVEHSGKDGQKGEGMITICVCLENKPNDRKILETHIFDYGTLGIIPKLREYTQKNIVKINELKNELSLSQEKVKTAYIKDLELLNSDFTLEKFIKDQILEQQKFRHIGHYGINKLCNLIKNPLEGDMFIASKGINEEQEYFNENAENFTLKIGTHYFIKIPFIAENFKKLDKPVPKQPEFFTLGSSQELKEFMKKDVVRYKLDEFNALEKEKANFYNFTGILDITVDKKIDKKFVGETYLYFDKLSVLNSKCIIALNLENCLDGESNLLRFLGYLAFEYEQSFVIYNLEFEVYEKMIDDNKVFADARCWESFWHETKGMLIFSKIKGKDFYFADILFGKSKKHYCSVNKILSLTFPNSASIVDVEVENAQLDDSIHLSDFFYQNAFLPYDILLKSKEKGKEKELLLFNIKTILENPLSEKDKNEMETSSTTTELTKSEKDLKKYIDKFEGYRIPKTHFKIGNKIHSSDFYYAKRLFQNSFYSVRLALHLARMIDDNIRKTSKKIVDIITEYILKSDITITDWIKEMQEKIETSEILKDSEEKKYIIEVTKKIPNKRQDIESIISNSSKKEESLFQGEEYILRGISNVINDIVKQVYIEEHIALMGYEMYSELLLSLIEKFLSEIYGYNVNHCVTRSEDDKLIFLPKDTFESYLGKYNERKMIIIVPIASTGSTARKIEKNIREQIYKYEKSVNKKINEEDARKLADEYKFVSSCYNILWAKFEDENFEKYIENKNQTEIINLSVVWYNLQDCPLCYGGFNENNKEIKTRPLFDTDSSSLTPSLIFGNPKCKKNKFKNGNEVESSVKFDFMNFKIKYKSVARNNNYRIYDIDPDEFVAENNKKPECNINKWLESIKKYLESYSDTIKQQIVDYKEKSKSECEKEIDVFFQNYKLEKGDNSLTSLWFEKYVELYKENKSTADSIWNSKLLEYIKSIEIGDLKSTDKIVIVAPCHESNSRFLNLVNEYVFSSAATIIHHQNDVDFVENFSLLNNIYLRGKNTKIFYVDDALITGKHFFELFDLISEVTENSQPLTASIFIYDQAPPFIHERVVCWSKNYFAFSSFNQPSTLRRPLEYERKRYESLQESTLHDALHEHFHKKANRLNPEKIQPKEDESSEKSIRRLKMFEATHKIYDYFTKNEDVPNLANDEERREFVDFKLKFKGNVKNELDMNQAALLKVLSQYPFILYKELRKKTFDWHKKLLEEVINKKLDEEPFSIKDDYDYFSTFKFQLRRAAFLGNYQVLERVFLEKLLTWFIKISKYIKENEKRFNSNKLEQKEEENLRDFPVFALGNYVEMIKKNPWVAYRILEAFKVITKEPEWIPKIKSSNQSRQFLRMLEIEAVSVIDDFMKIVKKDYRFAWRDMYKGADNLIRNTEYISRFFFERRREFLKTNKYKITKAICLNNDSKDTRKQNWTAMKNYLWIKQLLYADCIDKDSYIKNIDYQIKIDAIIDKMREFYSARDNVQAFFIVTDGQQKPYVLQDKQNLLYNFRQEFDTDKQINDLNKKIKEIEALASLTKEVRVDLKKKKETKNELETRKIESQVIIDFLNGELSNTKNAPKTTIEFVHIQDDKWENIYNDKEESLIFMPKNLEYKWLYLMRISKLQENEDGKCDFAIQGLLGFYSKKDLREYVFPKQLLMLLRKDMSIFIDEHHKNDEFSALRASKIAERFAYLAGHGRQTMMRLAKSKDTRNVIVTMEKLQLLYATKNLWKINRHEYTGKEKEKIEKDFVKGIFMPYKLTNMFEIEKNDDKSTIKEAIKSYINAIYNANCVENEISISTNDNATEETECDTKAEVSVDIQNAFNFNPDILMFIIFELIVNAKKNRWHCLENKKLINSLCIKIFNKKKEDNAYSNKLTIEMITTGAKIGKFKRKDGSEHEIIETINSGKPIKTDNEIEGVYLIQSVLKNLGSDEALKMESKCTKICHNYNNKQCGHNCELFLNKTIITINPMEE